MSHLLTPKRDISTSNTWKLEVKLSKVYYNNSMLVTFRKSFETPTDPLVSILLLCMAWSSKTQWTAVGDGRWKWQENCTFNWSLNNGQEKLYNFGTKNFTEWHTSTQQGAGSINGVGWWWRCYIKLYFITFAVGTLTEMPFPRYISWQEESWVEIRATNRTHRLLIILMIERNSRI